MPRLTEFYGIVIYVYFGGHNPPHFHAIYGEHEALVASSDVAVIGGTLPRTAARLVEQWRAERERGTVSFPGGIDFDPDVLHGDAAAASSSGPVPVRQNRLEHSG